MHIYISKSVLRLFAIAFLLISFAGYNFIRAYDESVWFPPDPGTPPANNVAAPVNLGTKLQVKNGPLGVDTLSIAGGSLGITSNRPMEKFSSINPTDPINDWYQFTESNLVSHLPTMSFAYDRDNNGTYANDYPIPLILNVGTTPVDDRAQFAGEVKANKVSVGGGSINITDDTPQIEFNDTNGDNNKWWLHSNAYGTGPRMHFLYDRNNNGIWDANDGMPTMYLQAGAAANGTQDQLNIPGTLNSQNVQTGQTHSGGVYADRYCNSDGSKCVTVEQIMAGINPPPDTTVWLVNHQHSDIQCTALGGTLTWDGGNQFCRMNGSCAAGWAWYNHWAQYPVQTVSQCNKSCYFSAQSWSTSNAPSCMTACTDGGHQTGSSFSLFASPNQYGCY